MNYLHLIHIRLYLFFLVTVFLPQLLLILLPAWRIPTFSFAFIGIIVMTRLLGESDKTYKDKARLIAQRQLHQSSQRVPSKEAVESLARKILDARVLAFYLSGALSFGLAYLSTVV